MKSREFKEVTRITLVIHHGLCMEALELLKSIGVNSVMLESARTARIRIKTTLLDFLGFSDPIEDSPTDIIRIIVHPNEAEKTITFLIEKLDLRIAGRGAVYAQNLQELSDREVSTVNIEKYNKVTLLHDLTLITGIQSQSGSGESISKVALRLGAGVPIVSLGKGTGIRDRLGLLRITISPEKELTYLLVPSFDANGLQNLLIEKGKLNRPGGGFMYQTPIRFGSVDPLVRVGYQAHAASLEQIIAAIDDIKKDTSWRKRIFENGGNTLPPKTSYTHREICFICPVDHSEDYIHAAMDCGAAGATMTSMRNLNLIGEDTDEITNYENAIICVKKEDEPKVIEAISKIAEEKGETDWFVQTIPASSIYATYKKK
jgi:nitrogen regulatory protein PII